MRARRPGRHSDEVMGPRALAAMADAARRSREAGVGPESDGVHDTPSAPPTATPDDGVPAVVVPGAAAPDTSIHAPRGVPRPFDPTWPRARHRAIAPSSTPGIRPRPDGAHSVGCSRVGDGGGGRVGSISIGSGTPARAIRWSEGGSAQELGADRVGEPDGDRRRSPGYVGGPGRRRWLAALVRPTSRCTGDHAQCTPRGPSRAQPEWDQLCVPGRHIADRDCSGTDHNHDIRGSGDGSRPGVGDDRARQWRPGTTPRAERIQPPESVRPDHGTFWRGDGDDRMSRSDKLHRHGATRWSVCPQRTGDRHHRQRNLEPTDLLLHLNRSPQSV